MKITDYIDGKVTYDPDGAYLWINSVSNNGILMLGEIRGWGHIQHIKDFVIQTKDGKGIDYKAAEQFQDEVGQFVADAVNEKIERLKANS